MTHEMRLDRQPEPARGTREYESPHLEKLGTVTDNTHGVLTAVPDNLSIGSQ